MQDLNNIPVTKEEDEAMDALSRLGAGVPLDVEKLAIESGVLVANKEYTTWTDYDAVHQLAKFAQAVVKESNPTTQDILNNMAIPQPEPTLEGIVQNICTQLQLLATVINQTKAQPNTTPPEGDQSLQECVSTTLQQAEWFKEVVEEKIGDMDFDYQIESAVETHFSNSFCLDDHVDITAEVESKVEDIAEDLLRDIVEERLAEIVSNKLQNLRITFD
jgi:hypothetical protein